MLSVLILAASLAAASLVSALPTVEGSTDLTRRHPPAQFITRCTVPNTAALTFDDGPHVWLKNISDTLHNAGAKGTFFFSGVNLGHCIYDEDQVERVQYAYNQGHQIAHHTWSNPVDIAHLSFDEIHNEFFLMEEALLKIIGAYPAWARTDNVVNDLILQVAGQRFTNIAAFSYQALDDLPGASAASVMKGYDELVAVHPDTILALNHELLHTTAFEVVPYIVKLLQGAGYNLVTLSECLGMAPYQALVVPRARDETWTCDGKPTQKPVHV